MRRLLISGTLVIYDLKTKISVFFLFPHISQRLVPYNSNNINNYFINMLFFVITASRLTPSINLILIHIYLLWFLLLFNVTTIIHVPCAPLMARIFSHKHQILTLLLFSCCEYVIYIQHMCSVNIYYI